jgi:hypothetical protein
MSLLLLGLCMVAAAYLYRQQANTAEILDQNIITRKIDRALESTAEDLVRAHRAGNDRIDNLQEGFEELLAQARDMVDSEEEGTDLRRNAARRYAFQRMERFGVSRKVLRAE